MKRFKTLTVIVLLFGVAFPTLATDYFLSNTGSNAHNGKTRSNAFATLGKALQVAKPGDNVYILPGTYQVTEAEITKTEDPYKIVYNINLKGKESSPICFLGLTENGERPVFDFSAVNPTGYRVTAFYVTGSYLVFRNFEVVGIKVNITEHTQSENFRVTNGSYCTFENIACHDGMGIGFYLTKNAHHNLFLNCDAYNNYDPVSERGGGGNCDGFGCHVSAGNEHNIFIGCRAWNNSDDGYDLINCYSPATFCYSYAYKNGYDAEGISRGDGNGFKAGGFGMSAKELTLGSDGIPQHEVYQCIATYNKSNGFYANHHLGGISFHDNSAYKNNRYNYSLVNRRGAAATDNVDVNGYGHVIENNLSFGNNHVTALDGSDEQNTIANNSFHWDNGNWTNDNMETSVFESTKIENIIAKRNADGHLPYKTLQFMKQKSYMGYGSDFSNYEQEMVRARNLAGAEGSIQTAISLPSIAFNSSASTFFDLQGHKYDVKPKKPGIYVNNNRKIIIIR